MTEMLDGSVIRIFRLANGPDDLGLSCNPDGLFLAGVPLLSRTQAGFAQRPASEITALIKAAYGAGGDQIRLQSSLGSIARALNSGDIALAAIAAVQTQTPDLSREAAARLANVEQKISKQKLVKFDPAEPRDWHGRWTTNGAASSAAITVPAGQRAANQATDRTSPSASNPEQDASDRNALLMPVGSTVSNDDANSDQAQQPNTPEQEFEAKYDDLGPVDFAKRVIQFGDWLGREGTNLSPEEKQRALAEYSFLQNRLSFWLGYDYKPPMAQGNLISAAQTLYQGAINGGIVQVGNLPESMLAVGGVASFFTDGAPRIRPSTKPAFDEASSGAPQPPKEMEGLAGIADRTDADFEWNGSIASRKKFEGYIAEQDPNFEQLRDGSKTFDLVNRSTGEAISAKTMNTLSVTYIKNPQEIYRRVTRYVDAAVNYQPRKSDLDPSDIQSKTLHLAVPEWTSPTQWRYLLRAMIYGKDNGVTVVITRIRG